MVESENDTSSFFEFLTTLEAADRALALQALVPWMLTDTSEELAVDHPNLEVSAQFERLNDLVAFGHLDRSRLLQSYLDYLQQRGAVAQDAVEELLAHLDD